MKKVFLTIILTTIYLLSFSTTYNSKSEYRGDWESLATWSGSIPPNIFASNGHTVNINGTVEANSDVVFLNNSTLNVNNGDTLVIKGDLTLNNNSTFFINIGAVLIVVGNLVVNNNFNILAGGKLVVVNDFNANGNVNITTGPTADVYVFGDVNATSIHYIGSVTTTGSLEEFLINEPALEIFTETIIGNPLPITLKEFKGEFKDNKIIINWITSSEENNDYFSLLKSLDGLSFSEIFKISGSDNSVVEKKYEYVDEDFSNIQYYKLQQTDYNNLKTESKIIVVSVDNSNNVYFKFSNSNNTITITNLKIEEEYFISICDIAGKVLTTKSISGFTEVVLPLNSIYNGFLILKSNNLKKVFKF